MSITALAAPEPRGLRIEPDRVSLSLDARNTRTGDVDPLLLSVDRAGSPDVIQARSLPLFGDEVSADMTRDMLADAFQDNTLTINGQRYDAPAVRNFIAAYDQHVAGQASEANARGLAELLGTPES